MAENLKIQFNFKTLSTNFKIMVIHEYHQEDLSFLCRGFWFYAPLGQTGLAGHPDQAFHSVCSPENIFLSQFPEDEF